jgi:hypothetical protein
MVGTYNLPYICYIRGSVVWGEKVEAYINYVRLKEIEARIPFGQQTSKNELLKELIEEAIDARRKKQQDEYHAP